jgi:predicted SnoaL-like aldol condensation-catalyzing enzyme
MTVSSKIYATSNQATDNMQIATAFFEAVTIKKDFEMATQYLGSRFTEHSPHAADGYKGLQDLIGFLKQYPHSQFIVKRTIVDGDYVMLHVNTILEPNTLGQAVMELFRLQNGKVVEHWDITQDVPVNSENPNGMF